jgi:hypothetical protein
VARLGIVNNVRAGRTRARLGEVRDLLRNCGAEVREVEDLPSIRAATRELLAAGVDVLAVNGGDGTAQAVITELQQNRAALEDLAILPGGTTNLSAHDLNGRLDLPSAVDALLAQLTRPAAGRRRVARPLLEVQVTASAKEYGFFLGAGAILAGMRHFREHIGARGMRDELAAGLSLLRGLAGVAGGEHEWSQHRTEVTAAAAPSFRGLQNLVLATTLERLLLGLRPWWGTEHAAVHLTAVAHKPAAFLRVLPAVLRGRRHRLATPANGYCSANVAELVLQAPEGFALDGQVFTAAPGTTVRVRATKPVEFLKLGGS